TVTPSVVKGPVQGVEQANVIPSRVKALLDIRLTAGPDEATVAGEIDAVCRRVMARCPGSVVEWEPVSGFRLATKVERTEPLVRAVAAGGRPAAGPGGGVSGGLRC